MRDIGNEIAKVIKNTDKEHLILELLGMQQEKFNRIPCRIEGDSITFKHKHLASLLSPYMNTVLSKMNVAFSEDAVTLVVAKDREEPVNVAEKHNCKCNCSGEPDTKRVSRLTYDEASGDISYVITESSEIPTEDWKTVESKYLSMLKEKLDALAEGYDISCNSIAESMKKYLNVKGYEDKETSDNKYIFCDFLDEVTDALAATLADTLAKDIAKGLEEKEEETAFERDLKAYKEDGLTRKEMMTSVFGTVSDMMGDHVDILVDMSKAEVTAVCESSEVKDNLVKKLKAAVKKTDAADKLKVEQVNNKVIITVED